MLRKGLIGFGIKSFFPLIKRQSDQRATTPSPPLMPVFPPNTSNKNLYTKILFSVVKRFKNCVCGWQPSPPFPTTALRVRVLGYALGHIWFLLKGWLYRLQRGLIVLEVRSSIALIKSQSDQRAATPPLPGHHSPKYNKSKFLDNYFVQHRWKVRKLYILRWQPSKALRTRVVS